MEDPIAALLAVSDRFGNRVDLLMGLRGMDPGVFGRASLVPLSGRQLRVVGLEDFIAMKAFASGPQDIIDARAAIAANRASIDLELLRELARRFGRGAAHTVEILLAESK
jgi:predicted nucleotidyltransferase